MDTFNKQPAELLDFDVDYTEFLYSTTFPDSLVSAAVTTDAGITLVSTVVAVSYNIVKVWLSGGTSGTSYLITVRATTASGRIKENEFRVKVKEIQ